MHHTSEPGGRAKYEHLSEINCFRFSLRNFGTGTAKFANASQFYLARTSQKQLKHLREFHDADRANAIKILMRSNLKNLETMFSFNYKHFEISAASKTSTHKVFFIFRWWTSGFIFRAVPTTKKFCAATQFYEKNITLDKFFASGKTVDTFIGYKGQN